MSNCRWELVAADKLTVLAEPLLDTIVVEDGERDGRLADPANANESDWSEISCQSNDILDQFVTSETDSRRQGRRFTRCAGCKYKRLGSLEFRSLTRFWP